MKKMLLGTIILALSAVVSVPAMAGVNISIGIALPPPVVFQAPPDVIVLPDTNDVYVVPGMDIDLFFWSGWWWRLWEGRWYRSHYYDRGWAYYSYVPRFYYDVDPGWRRYYRAHDWHGHRWNYEPIPYGRLHQNWRGWSGNRYWERQRTWGVERYQPRPQPQRQQLRQQRQHQYQQRPDVQRHQQQMREQQRQHQQGQPGASQPRRQQQPQQQRYEHQGGQQHQGESQRRESPGKPDRGEGQHGR
jgi:hypothetical protein